MDHVRHLRHAARLALRGHGGAEPNPMVGCVIVSQDDQIVGWGYHRRCGEPHAEVHALRRAGTAARGATVYVTLEPCNHTGRTGPCSQALIDAGVKRVVIARLDPHKVATGGAQHLRSAGIEVLHIPDSVAASVSEPFAHRVTTGLPWVIAKWAQTLDGKLCTRTGESQWISGAESRRLVHRERGRVCAILTGIGTVAVDDPMLTARNVRQRRVARRVIADPNLTIDLGAKLVTTASEFPTTVACRDDALHANAAKVQSLNNAGAEVLAVPAGNDELPMETLLRQLVLRHDVTNVFVEAGPGMLSRLFRDQLVNQALVFIAPLLLGDQCAPSPIRGMTVSRLTDGISLELIDQRTRGSDVMLRYRTSGAHGA